MVYHGGAESLEDGYFFAACFFCKSFGELDAVAYAYVVNAFGGSFEEGVTDKAAYDVGFYPRGMDQLFKDHKGWVLTKDLCVVGHGVCGLMATKLQLISHFMSLSKDM